MSRTFLTLAVLSVTAIACQGGEEALRFIDGVPVGGPPPAASAVEWTVGHYTGEANAALFAAAPSKRLEYVVNLAGRQGQVAWADRVVLQTPGRVPATCIILSDGNPERRSATIETWIADGPDADGATAFALGIDGASKSFTKRARTDREPPGATPLGGPVQAFEGSISNLVTGRIRNGVLEPQFDRWSSFFIAGNPPRISASHQRSLRLLQRVGDLATSLEGRWACLVVSGFPGADPADQSNAPFRAWRFTTAAGERLVLKQVYLGKAAEVERLGVAVLHESGEQLVRRGETWTWNGADWTSTPAWSGTSSAKPIVLAGTP